MYLKHTTRKPLAFPMSIRCEADVIHQQLRLPCAELKIVAGKGENEPARLFLRAYTGVAMDLPGWFDPVVVDLEGAVFEFDRTPIVADHDLSKRVGHTTSTLILKAGEKKTFNGEEFVGPLILSTGVKSSSSNVAKVITADMAAGYPFQASIGADVQDGYELKDGQIAIVNGMEVVGPAIVATRTVIKEISVLTLGADSNTQVRLVASFNQGERRMSFEEFVKSLALDPTKLSDDQQVKLKAQWEKMNKLEAAGKQGGTPPKVPGKDKDEPPSNPPSNTPSGETDITARRKQEAEEARRVDGIISASRSERFKGIQKVKFEDNGQEREVSLGDFKAHAIEAGMSSTDYELALYRAEREIGNENDNDVGTTFHIKSGEINARALQASMLRENGMVEDETNKISGKKYGLLHSFKEEDLEASHDPRYRGITVQKVMKMQLRAAGMYYDDIHFDPIDVIEKSKIACGKLRGDLKASAFSTFNLANIFEDSMNKAMYAAWDAVESVWPFICGRKNLKDFRPHYTYRLIPDGTYRKVAADGELKHISRSDQKYTTQLDTYGAMVGIDRQTMINDDMGAILGQATDLGTMGAQRIEESVFVLLLSNPDSFFHANNGNLVSGAGTALSIDSLSTMDTAWRNRVINGKPISVMPRILLVGTVLRTLANQLWNEARLQATGDTDALVFTNNPHVGLYRPFVSPYLNNTAIRDEDGNALSGQSATQWYTFGDPRAPQGSALVIGFLNGREQPYFDQAETQFNIPGGIQFRSYHDWGVAMHVTELAYKSAGA